MNPILHLASRHLENPNVTPQQQQAMFQKMLAAGANSEHLKEALVIVCSREHPAPIPLMDAVGQIAAMLLLRNDQPEVAGQVHFQIAKEIGRRDSVATEILPAMQAAVRHYQAARKHLADDSDLYANTFIDEADAWQSLANIGVEPEKSLRHAVALYGKAAPCFPKDSPNRGRCLLNEAVTWHRLADIGVEPEKSLRHAVALYGKAAPCSPPDSHDHGRCRMNEASAWQRLADIGLEPEKNLRHAIALYGKAASCFPPESPSRSSCLTNEACAWDGLAEIGVEPENSLRHAAALHAKAAPCFPPGSVNRGRGLVNEAVTWQSLANIGVEPEKSLRHAIALYGKAASCFPPDSPDRGICLMNEANTWRSLADLGLEPEKNLRHTIALYGQAAPCFPPDSPVRGSCYMNEAISWQNIADLGLEPEKNLRHAIALYGKAASCFPPDSPDRGRCHANEANSWLSLAEIDVEPEKNLRHAIHVYGQASPCLPPDSPERGMCLMNEANTKLRLVEIGAEPGNNLHESIALYEMADHCLLPGSPGWANNRRNQAHALRKLGDSATLHRAHGLLKDGLEVVERTRGSMLNEASRRGFLETMIAQYAGMVELCLALADPATEPNAEQREAFLWEAWHWCHRSKSRALLDMMQTAHPELDTPESQALREERIAAAAELDRLEREIATMAKKPPTDLRVSVSQRVRGMFARAFGKRPEIPADKRRQMDALMVQREAAAARHQAAQDAELNAAGPLAAAEVPEGKELVRRLRALQENVVPPAGRQGAVQRAAPHSRTRRTLVAEYFCLDNEEVVLFLVPLWEDRAPVVQRLQLPLKTVAAAAGKMLTAHGRLRGETRAACRNGTPAPPLSGEERRTAHRESNEALASIAPLATAITDRIKSEGWQPDDLVLCPHFVLNLLPIHAAPVDGKPLMEHLPVAYLPSPALATELQRAAADDSPVPGVPQALVLGDPQGDDETHPMRLPGARAEANEVAKIARAAGLACDPILGQAVTTTATAARAPQARILHAALHSLLDSRNFLRSGLELHDRRWTVPDVMQHNLRQLLLVFLSSCDSGQARPGRTDDLMALARAFFLAGAPSVIATLWELSDAAGAFFAPEFHRAWLEERLPMVVAFQKAMLATRAKFRHPKEGDQPFFWAPFVLVGKWDTVWQSAAA